MMTTAMERQLSVAQQKALAIVLDDHNRPLPYYRAVPVEVNPNGSFAWSVAEPGGTPDNFVTIDGRRRAWHSLRLTEEVARDLAASLTVGRLARQGYSPYDLVQAASYANKLTGRV